MKTIFSFVVVACLLQVELCAQNTPTNPYFVQNTDEYVIGPEDVLAINVWMEPEITSRVVVRPDGKIGLPLLNDVQASGLTARQLQEKITNGLKKYVQELSVAVIVVEIRSNVVYVTGAINKPGAFILGAPTTVVELIIRAGGLQDFAKSESIQILRKSGDLTIRFPFNYKLFLEGKDYKQDIQLRRGDIVFVP